MTKAAAVSSLLGMTVGIVADALHMPRRKAPVLTDLMISIWILWIWLIIAFDICAGDLRSGYCAAAALGAMGWRIWLSPLIRPIFSKIWAGVWGIFRFLFVPIRFFGKKLKKFRKKLFPTEKKWVTIGKDKMPK